MERIDSIKLCPCEVSCPLMPRKHLAAKRWCILPLHHMNKEHLRKATSPITGFQEGYGNIWHAPKQVHKAHAQSLNQHYLKLKLPHTNKDHRMVLLSDLPKRKVDGMIGACNLIGKNIGRVHGSTHLWFILLHVNWKYLEYNIQCPIIYCDTFFLMIVSYL